MNYRQATKQKLDQVLARIKETIFNGEKIPHEFEVKVRDRFAPAFAKAEALDMGGDYFLTRTLNWVDLDDLIMEKRIQDAIKADGYAYFQIWSRDCDMCESTRTTKVRSVKAYKKLIHDLAEGAEGPVSCNLISKEEWKDFQPTHRDRVMENFENGGNGYWL